MKNKPDVSLHATSDSAIRKVAVTAMYTFRGLNIIICENNSNPSELQYQIFISEAGALTTDKLFKTPEGAGKAAVTMIEAMWKDATERANIPTDEIVLPNGDKIPLPNEVTNEPA